MKSHKLSVNKIGLLNGFGLMTSDQAFELMRYGIIGTLSFLTYVGLSNGLHRLELPVLLSTLLAGIMSLMVSYFGHIHVTYKVPAQHTRMSWRFLALTLINLSSVQLLTWLMHIDLGLSFSTTSVLVSLITPLISWPIGKFWVFSR